MTDDFQLFQDQADGDPVDADIALITAYLARELSLLQIVAVEDRLANDAAFREKARPIVEAWVAPTRPNAARARQESLSREEVEAGWQRYVNQHTEPAAHGTPALVIDVPQPKRRKVSMTRIAAGIAAITLPIVTLAQVVVYASKHPEAPGHSVARSMVRPFVEPAPVQDPQAPERPTPAVIDARVGKELERQAPEVQRAEPVQVPAAEPKSSAGVAPVMPEKPDRERIAALVKQHMPALTRGDTTASYVVLVMDAADKYVWGTYGSGTLQIVVGGDKRTAAERSAFQRENALEYSGAVAGGRGGTLVRPSSGAAGVGAGRATGVATDTSGRRAVAVARGGGRGGFVFDTGWVQIRSVTAGVVRRRDTASTLTRSGDVAIVARTASGLLSSIASDTSGGQYTIGIGRLPDAQAVNLNEAPGLQDPTNDESGIQGLKAASLTMGETYVFRPGQLTTGTLRVIVVRLAPGTGWNGR